MTTNRAPQRPDLLQSLLAQITLERLRALGFDVAPEGMTAMIIGPKGQRPPTELVDRVKALNDAILARLPYHAASAADVLLFTGQEATR